MFERKSAGFPVRATFKAMFKDISGIAKKRKEKIMPFERKREAFSSCLQALKVEASGRSVIQLWHDNYLITPGYMLLIHRLL